MDTLISPSLSPHRKDRSMEKSGIMPFCSFERWGEQLPWTVRPLSLKHPLGKRKVTFLIILEFEQRIFCSSFWPFPQLTFYQPFFESIVWVMFLICNGSFLLFGCSFLLNIFLTRCHFSKPLIIVIRGCSPLLCPGSSDSYGFFVFLSASFSPVSEAVLGWLVTFSHASYLNWTLEEAWKWDSCPGTEVFDSEWALSNSPLWSKLPN